MNFFTFSQPPYAEDWSDSPSEHMTVKATTTATEEGTFTALASAFGNIDRTGERVVKGAFTSTIRRWQEAGRDVPLVWDHGRNARDVIGSVSSASMEERDQGLYVEGRLDIEDSELAREAWRSVKRGRISLSFGYLVEQDREGRDGVKELTRLDLMEITLTSVPANPDARVLSSKNAVGGGESLNSMSDAELKDYSMKMIDGIDRRAAQPITVRTFRC